jgi:hypothetical protein
VWSDLCKTWCNALLPNHHWTNRWGYYNNETTSLLDRNQVATGFPFRNEIYNRGGSVGVHVVCVGQLESFNWFPWEHFVTGSIGGHIFWQQFGRRLESSPWGRSVSHEACRISTRGMVKSLYTVMVVWWNVPITSIDVFPSRLCQNRLRNSVFHLPLKEIDNSFPGSEDSQYNAKYNEIFAFHTLSYSSFTIVKQRKVT